MYSSPVIGRGKLPGPLAKVDTFCPGVVSVSFLEFISRLLVRPTGSATFCLQLGIAHNSFSKPHAESGVRRVFALFVGILLNCDSEAMNPTTKLSSGEGPQPDGFSELG